MVTGGFKGKRVRISEDDLQDKLHRIFPNARIVGEYGMTELSSQLWSTEIGKPFYPPPWMHVFVLSIQIRVHLFLDWDYFDFMIWQITKPSWQ